MDINLIHVSAAVIILGLMNIISIFWVKSHLDTQSKMQKDSNEKHINQLNEKVLILEATLEESIKKTVEQHQLSKDSIASLIDSSSQEIAEKMTFTQNELEVVKQEHSRMKNELLMAVKHFSEKSAMSTNNAIQKLQESNKTLSFERKQDWHSGLEQLTSLIASLRIENLIEITNELAKHQELSVDTDEFTKQLGDCKVLKITDKHSGQVTEVFYENGIKRSSDTFDGDLLKYQMFFNEDGKPEKGLEFDKQERIIFEYLYDDAGEIHQRTDVTYDENGNKSEQVKAY
ncbi:hypothetical protein [Thalassotalea aquiviva]|uniref:hypothetical protein n=1 Tax=Thalassotalea aquiviva TaxID=3242415 RepID=UPI00352A79E4